MYVIITPRKWNTT